MRRNFTAKQIAAQRKFAAAARAGEFGRNPKDDRMYEAIKKTESVLGKGLTKAKSIAAATVRVFQREKNPRRKNKTIIHTRKVKIISANPRRRNVTTAQTLVIYGTAEKTPQGWKIGGQTIEQGKGVVLISRKGFYLDKATGTVYSKRVKNAAGYKDEGGVFHPIRERTRSNPTVKSIREKFTGTQSRKSTMMNAPKGTPSMLAKLGRLISIKTARVHIKPSRKNPANAVWLCADENGRLHLCTSGNRLVDGGAQSFGEVHEIEYEACKPHLGQLKPTIFVHKMGEEGGNRPELISDGDGGLKFKGGSYHIASEGIID